MIATYEFSNINFKFFVLTKKNKKYSTFKSKIITQVNNMQTNNRNSEYDDMDEEGDCEEENMASSSNG